MLMGRMKVGNTEDVEDIQISRIFLTRVILFQIVWKIFDLGTDISKAILLLYSVEGRVYASFVMFIKWAPAIPAFLHLHEVIRQEQRVCPTENARNLPVNVPAAAADKLCLRMFGKYVLCLALFPVLSVILFIRFLFRHWGASRRSLGDQVRMEQEQHLCQEISLLGTAAEAPLQIVFTLWLMIREVLEPPDLGDLSLVSWSKDRFGNPFPLPSLPAASILTSLLSLNFISVWFNLTWSSAAGQQVGVCRALLHITVQISSLLFRLLSWSILFVFLDLKALIPLLINFIVNYLLSIVYTGRPRSANQFVWMTALLGVVFPCWYSRTSTKQESRRDFLMMQNFLSCLLLLICQSIVWILVNFTAFKYNENCITNTQFNFTTVYIISHATLQGIYCLLCLDKEQSIYSRVFSWITIGIVFCLPLAFLVCGMLGVFKADDSVYVLLKSEDDNTVWTKEVSGRFLSRVRDRTFQSEFRPVVHCADLDNNTTQAAWLVFNPTEAVCTSVLDNHMLTNYSVLLLETWEHKSSSPYPNTVGSLNVEQLRSLASSVVSLRKSTVDSTQKLLGDRMEAMLCEKSRADEIVQNPSNLFTVSCPISCLSTTSTSHVYLNHRGYRSRDVQLVIEEEMYNHQRYALREQKVTKRLQNLHCKQSEDFLDLDQTFCDINQDIFDERYLRNYLCCQPSGSSVLGPSGCRNLTGQVSWGGWGPWSNCKQVWGKDGSVQLARRRLRFARRGDSCVQVELSQQDCSDDRQLGPCASTRSTRFLPTCD